MSTVLSVCQTRPAGAVPVHDRPRSECALQEPPCGGLALLHGTRRFSRLLRCGPAMDRGASTRGIAAAGGRVYDPCTRGVPRRRLRAAEVLRLPEVRRCFCQPRAWCRARPQSHPQAIVKALRTARSASCPRWELLTETPDSLRAVKIKAGRAHRRGAVYMRHSHMGGSAPAPSNCVLMW